MDRLTKQQRCSMPWKEIRLMDQKTKFVLAVREQDISVAKACRDAGISRKTGYKWLERYSKISKNIKK